MKKLKQKCAICTACTLVTETITGFRLEPKDQYYQCIADIEADCYEDKSMYEQVTILDKVIEFKEKMSKDYHFISVIVSELDNFGFVLLKHKVFPIECKYQFNIESESWEKFEGKEMESVK